MIVDLPEPDEPTSAVTDPGSARKLHAVQHRLLRRVSKLHMLKAHNAFDLAQLDCARRIRELVLL